MRDCQNENLRDLLPEYAIGRLDPVLTSEIEAHLAACPSCATELAVVRAAHNAFRAPKVDIAKIIGALPQPPSRDSRVIELTPRIEKRARRFTSWRIAATIATIAVGGVSVAMLQSILSDKPPHQHQIPQKGKPAEAASEASGLSVGGNLNDLSDQEMQTLLDKLDEMDAVPSAEPQPAVSGIRAAAGVQ
ncbi:MAG TPA: zf-HC2 domain-containing protein [Gemmatimonadaceae bacterium]|nr:zf-HC2 domain-containing protein [Gemmatimonadaceae bacterium]